MNVILENPLPIYAVGAVLATICGLAFLARRNLPSLLALLSVVGLTLLLALVERVVVTESEQVETTLYQLIADIEANDTDAVLSSIAPTATKMRADIEKLMPQADIKDSAATSVQIEVDTTSQPPTATSTFRGRIDGIHRRSGTRVFFFDRVEISWTKQDEQWLAEGYAVQHKGKSINPVESLRKNRPSN